MAQGYPPRRPPAEPGAPGPVGRHGYPDQGYPDQGYPDEGYPDQPAEPGRPGYPAEPQVRGATGRHGYAPEAEEPAGPGYPEQQPGRGYRDDPGEPPRGYRDDQRQPARRGRPDERRPEVRRSEERRRPSQPSRPGRARTDTFDDDDVMPWSGTSIYPTGPGRRQLRPPPDPSGDQEPPGTDGEAPPEARAGSGRGRRAAAARARKSRRRLVLGGVAVVVVVVVVLGILGKLPFQGGPAKSPDAGLVTTYQAGEFRSVPNVCQEVSAATLSQYMPGKVSQVSQALGSATQSQCTWTLDTRPNFRVLTASTQAYAPSLLSTGNGSATFGAIDAYNQQLQALRSPPKGSKAPQAQLGGAVGLGNSAFTALQVFHLGGDVSDEITVVARDRNVVIVITMEGQESGGGFGPAPDATLRAGALAAAHQVLAGLR